MTINQIIGIVFAVVGVIFSFAGVYILYRFKGFYIKASTTSLIDSTGFILIIIGIIIYSGVSFVSLKVLFLLFFVMMLNPLSNHYIVKGAYRSGYKDDMSEENLYGEDV